jgi:hypothetical protein
MRYHLIRLSTVGLLALALAACASQPTPPPAAETAPTTQPAPTGEAGEAYPAPGAAQQSGYPAPATADSQAAAPAGYPAPQQQAELPEGPAFTIDTPLTASQSAVTGTGPAGVPIRLVNMTRNGEEIGQAVIGEDGKYSITVSGLPAGEQVGIVLGDLTGTSFEPTQFLRGPGYEDIPQLGLFFAQASVQQ